MGGNRQSVLEPEVMEATKIKVKMSGKMSCRSDTETEMCVQFRKESVGRSETI